MKAIARGQPLASLRSLLVSRLVALLMLFGVVIFTLRGRDVMIPPLVAYGVASLVYCLYVLTRRARPFGGGFPVLVGVQLAFEMVLTAGVVHFTGGPFSQYPVLFVLTIISAAMVYHLVGTLLTASAASSVFALVVWSRVEFIYLLPPRLRVPPLSASGEDVFTVVFLYVCLFYIIAFVSGYLAERARTKGREADVATDALERERVDTEAILQGVGSAIVTVRGDGIIQYANDEAARILGVPTDEVVGRPYGDVFDGRSGEVSVACAAGLSGRSTRDVEVFVSRGESYVPAALTTVVLSSSGASRGVVVTLTDLTAVKEMERRIREVDRMAAIGELSAGIAHEIRNPLASISGSVQILASELKLSGENAQLMELITKEAARLSGILTDFLQFARVKPGVRERVDLSRVVSEVVTLVRNAPTAPGGVVFHDALVEGPLYVTGDETQIKSVVYNLALNAVEAVSSAEIRRVSFLSTRLVDVWPGADPNVMDLSGDGSARELVPLAVVDTGCGMPKSAFDRVFQPFYSTKRQGTGLGLSIVRRLVEALSGRIEFASEEGRGTAFVVYFPAYARFPWAGEVAVDDEEL